MRRKNFTIALNGEFQNYIKVLKEEYNINISALIRNTIINEYRRLTGRDLNDDD